MRTLGWMISAWLGLAALSLVTSAGGSTRAAGLLSGARTVFERALSPDVPAIPDRRTNTKE